MRLPDIVEQGEARAEVFSERIRGDIYICSCGNKCSLNEVEILSPDPWGEPFCPDCVTSFMAKKQLKA